jgi:hypothetical protein
VELRAWCEGRCPKHVELILEINKYSYLSHLVGFLYCFASYVCQLVLEFCLKSDIKCVYCAVRSEC